MYIFYPLETYYFKFKMHFQTITIIFKLSLLIILGDVDIICASNNTLCEEILKNFLTSSQKPFLLKNIRKSNNPTIVLSKPALLVFFANAKLQKDIKSTFSILNPNGKNFTIQFCLLTYRHVLQLIPHFIKLHLI
jgi:hypothetical protein